jgi:hypothetical protein
LGASAKLDKMPTLTIFSYKKYVVFIVDADLELQQYFLWDNLKI